MSVPRAEDVLILHMDAALTGQGAVLNVVRDDQELNMWAPIVP